MYCPNYTGTLDIWGGRAVFRKEGGLTLLEFDLIDDWKFNLVGRESYMQLENTVLCCIISYYCLCGCWLFSDVPTLPLCFKQLTHSAVKNTAKWNCCWLQLVSSHTLCKIGQPPVSTPLVDTVPTEWKTWKHSFLLLARAARVAEKSTGDLKNWVNTLYSPNLHVLCVQSHTNQHREAENKAGFKKFSFLMSNYFVPFTIEWMYLHFAPSVQPSKAKRKKSIKKLVAWADTWSTIVPHSRLWMPKKKLQP